MNPMLIHPFSSIFFTSYTTYTNLSFTKQRICYYILSIFLLIATTQNKTPLTTTPNLLLSSLTPLFDSRTTLRKQFETNML
ncbi:unnamed protein product [Lathyrus oleraceus]